MDRVYTSKDSDVIKFINYAKEKNWLYKWKMTADDMEGMVFRYGDKVIFGRIVVKLGRVVFRKYPFVDTRVSVMVINTYQMLDSQWMNLMMILKKDL